MWISLEAKKAQCWSKTEYIKLIINSHECSDKSKKEIEEIVQIIIYMYLLANS